VTPTAWLFFVFIPFLRSFCHQLAKKVKKSIANSSSLPIMPPHQRSDGFLVSYSQIVDNLLVNGSVNFIANLGLTLSWKSLELPALLELTS